MRTIDAHIHLDHYEEGPRESILREMKDAGVQSLVAVSMGPDSSAATREFHLRYPGQVYPAYGFHPEQPLPPDSVLEAFIGWIRAHAGEAAAIGEIGLPYYTRTETEQKGEPFALEPYIEVLETFLALAAELGKPVALHAVYEDADRVCDLLEKHGVANAHFHWFKGSRETVDRMIRSGYFVSFTPDLLYEEEIRTLARRYPLERIMAETDGPWPFEGPFAGSMTHPRMTADVVREVAAIKGLDVEETAQAILANTRNFYGIPEA